jgi:hypothetical protein
LRATGEFGLVTGGWLTGSPAEELVEVVDVDETEEVVDIADVEEAVDATALLPSLSTDGVKAMTGAGLYPGDETAPGDVGCGVSTFLRLGDAAVNTGLSG